LKKEQKCATRRSRCREHAQPALMRIYGSEYAARCDLFLRLFNLAIAISGIAIEPKAPRGLRFAPPVSFVLARSSNTVARHTRKFFTSVPISGDVALRETRLIA
jgi:hypothetical protein